MPLGMVRDRAGDVLFHYWCLELTFLNSRLGENKERIDFVSCATY